MPLVPKTPMGRIPMEKTLMEKTLMEKIPMEKMRVICPDVGGGEGITKSGNGVLTLSGTNTQTGTLNVSAGLLRVIGSTSSATAVASGCRSC